MSQIKKFESTQNERLAEHLVKGKLRAPIVKRIAKVPQSTVNHFYQVHHNRTSPSGQLPTNLLSHAAGYKQSTHAALIVMVYLRILEELKRSRPNSTREALTAHAFGRTLAFYNNDVCGGDPLLTPERAYALTQHFADRSSFARNAGSPNGIKVAKCSCCDIPLVVLSHYREHTCDMCLAPKKKH
ncbi:FlhC family transcriptional regulator [Burkholderia sp. Ac-20365]|uniref:FlhC family transcriptional regulator n=1 Tax=Burkholderia sp. Ac-20365 TaxID=2703897 RepID=UPI00197B8522|nr:FlhC family transcriptional regulator [Burkholderia sp. Ac-20365]MBN3761080.1 hypothetical protein [Burkholderia sp. Ac-20365]